MVDSVDCPALVTTTKVEDVGWGITRRTISQKPIEQETEEQEDSEHTANLGDSGGSDGPTQLSDIKEGSPEQAADASIFSGFPDTASGGILRSISAPNVGALWRRARRVKFNIPTSSSVTASPSKPSVSRKNSSSSSSSSSQRDVTIEEEEEYSIDLDIIYQKLRLSLRYRLPSLLLSIVLTFIICVWYYVTFPSTPRVSAVQQLHKPVDKWTNQEVLSWLDTNGFGNYQSGFADARVDGKLLLVLDSYDFSKDLGLSGLDSKKLEILIDSLRLQANDHPRDLWEYRRQYPYKTQVLGIALQTAPRPMLLYLYFVERETWQEIFAQGDGYGYARNPILSIIGLLLFPELMLAVEVIQFLPLHPVIVSVVFGNLFSSWLTHSNWLFEFKIRKVLTDMKQGWLWVMLVTVTFPFTPWFLADIFFFLTLSKDLLRPFMFLGVWLWIKLVGKGKSHTVQLTASKRKTSVSTVPSPIKNSWPEGCGPPSSFEPSPDSLLGPGAQAHVQEAAMLAAASVQGRRAHSMPESLSLSNQHVQQREQLVSKNRKGS
eukprot:gb/GEZN01005230.1/.p1 GENE.gb/GEZN01005230.1/~~gb/GEZN01005230.1/.p1  ORF type:complete len:546 (+),score=85.38 gb/GEZN01005230.1/:93-1730(+)